MIKSAVLIHLNEVNKHNIRMMYRMAYTYSHFHKSEPSHVSPHVSQGHDQFDLAKRDRSDPSCHWMELYVFSNLVSLDRAYKSIRNIKN